MSKMRIKTDVICLLILVSALFMINSIPTQFVYSKSKIISLNLNPNSLTPHVAIYIDNDGNFSDYGFPGTGALNDPYRIENLNITTAETVGIYISSTSFYFIIQNCYVESDWHGIEISYCYEDKATVQNCISNGIVVTNTDSIDIVDNLFYSGGQAFINIERSDNSNVDNNTLIPENGYASNIGIRLVDSESSMISYNNITKIREGIYIDHCFSSSIINNHLTDLSNNGYGKGINVYTSDGSVIEGNICSDCDNYGIYSYSFGSVSISRNIVSLSEYGIHVKTSTASQVEENTCFQNQIGIFIESSDSTIIEYNILYLNLKGIVTQSSDYLLISDNYCHSNEQNGLWIEDSKSSLITRNNCSSNDYRGALLKSVTVSNITYNNVSHNGDFGIALDSTSNCKFLYNLFRENENYSIYINTLSSANVLFHNSFIDNNPEGTSQCSDSGSVNLWYDYKKKEGNYWNDIGDNKTYAIDGLSNSIDKFPLNENLERTSILFPVCIFSLITIFIVKTQLRRRKKN